MSGAVAGSYLSASSAGALGSVVGVTPTQAFTGGALMYLGARIAGGCTRYARVGRYCATKENVADHSRVFWEHFMRDTS